MIKHMALLLAIEKKNNTYENDQTSLHKINEDDLFSGYTEKEF
jgi:hypothetical protein